MRNQQKVQLMAALLSEPEFLILDEPLSGLDPVNTDLFKRSDDICFALYGLGNSKGKNILPASYLSFLHCPLPPFLRKFHAGTARVIQI